MISFDPGHEAPKILILHRMGYDYLCPSCHGPAYGSDNAYECSSCQSGVLSSFMCAGCSRFVVSSVREGYNECNDCNELCYELLCNDCHICLACYNANQTTTDKIKEARDIAIKLREQANQADLLVANLEKELDAE